MWMIAVGAIVNLLVFFFERWWTAHHPVAPTPEAKAAFLAHVGKARFFALGSKRQAIAGKLFDKFAAGYSADPPMVELSTAALTADGANALAKRYAAGLTVTPEELPA